MYAFFRQFAEKLLRIPHDPEPPPGDEACTRTFRAAANYYKYLLVLAVLKMVLLLFVLLVSLVLPAAIAEFEMMKHGNKWGTVFWIIPVVALGIHIFGSIFSLVVLRLNFEKRWYVVTDRSLRTREGVLTVREMTVSFANIQNISFSQGPLQRLLGITDLRVDTAGGGGAVHGRGHQVGQNLHTAWFRGIDNANDIRELIQQRLRLLKDSGLGDHEELAADQVRPASPALLSVLREVHAEAAALRQAALRF